MQEQTWKGRFAQVGMAAVVLLTGAWVHAEDEPEAVGQVQSVIEQALQSDTAGELREYLIETVQSVQNPSAYWLGVTCIPASDALRSQLEIPAGEGLVVVAVAPEGPAAAAGIEVHDVLLEAGSTLLSNVGDLVDAIEVAAEEEGVLAVEVIRKGETLEVEVEPAKRPADLTEQLSEQAGELLRRIQAGGEPLLSGDLSEQAGNLLQRLQTEGESLRLNIPRPGAIMQELAAQFELPENMSITVTHEGAEPARIVVKRDDQVWELSEEDLSALPAEVRPYVRQALGYLPTGRIAISPPSEGEIRLPALKRLEEQANRSVDRAEDALERRLQRLNERLEKLESQLDEEDNSSTDE